MSGSQDYFDKLQGQVDFCTSQFRVQASFSGPSVFNQDATFSTIPKINTTQAVSRMLDLRVTGVKNQASGFTSATQDSGYAVDGLALLGVDVGRVLVSRLNVTGSDPDDYFDVFLDLPDQSSFSQVVLSTIGLGASSPTGAPTYQMYYSDGKTAKTAISSVVPDAHTSGNWLGATLDTTIPVTGGSVTVNRSRYTYALRIHNPYEGTMGSSVIIQALKATWVPGQVVV